MDLAGSQRTTGDTTRGNRNAGEQDALVGHAGTGRCVGYGAFLGQPILGVVCGGLGVVLSMDVSMSARGGTTGGRVCFSTPAPERTTQRTHPRTRTGATALLMTRG